MLSPHWKWCDQISKRKAIAINTMGFIHTYLQYLLSYFTSESHTNTPADLGGTIQGVSYFITPQGVSYFISYSDNRLFDDY